MKFLLTLFLIAASPAAACNTELISVQDDWTIVNEDRYDGRVSTRLTAEYTYLGEKPFRMIDGYVEFSDALGKKIYGAILNRDIGLSQGQSSTISGLSVGEGLLAGDLRRLGQIHRDDIIVTTCVRAVIYEDGTKEEFRETASKPRTGAAGDDPKAASAVFLVVAKQCAADRKDESLFNKAVTKARADLKKSGVSTSDIDAIVDAIKTPAKADEAPNHFTCAVYDKMVAAD